MLLLKRYIKTEGKDLETQKKRSKSLMQFFREYALGLAVAAAFSTTQVTGAFNFATSTMSSPGPGILATSGIAVQGLQWTIVALLCLLHLAISAMFHGDGEGAGAPPAEQEASGGREFKPAARLPPRLD
ncbi:hypothetical protein F5Y05DRAFT_364194 [Hypoxylon sp. FL0543]|nr:hypothetical protein F5Y05DRAFT_364194 [Hypoxylon sp. FL0543]